MRRIIENSNSSCECVNCNNNYNINSSVEEPTNMSIDNCKLNNCYTNTYFKSQVEPTDKHGNVTLNNLDKIDKTFKVIDAEKSLNSSCKGKTYINIDDSRLINAYGQILQLDKPPMNSQVHMNNTTFNKTLNKYGQNYNSYKDIKAGQYTYYISKDTEDAYFNPLFVDKAKVLGNVYKDPMDSLKPEYIRIIDKKLDPVRDKSDLLGSTCLSFINDSQHHREDLLERQMRKMNSQRYAPRWTYNKTQ